MDITKEYEQFVKQIAFSRDSNIGKCDASVMLVGFSAWLMLNGEYPFYDEILPVIASKGLDYSKCKLTLDEAHSIALDIFDSLNKKSPTANAIIQAADDLIPKDKRCLDFKTANAQSSSSKYPPGTRICVRQVPYAAYYRAQSKLDEGRPMSKEDRKAIAKFEDEMWSKNRRAELEERSRQIMWMFGSMAILLAIVALFDFVLIPLNKWVGDKVNDHLRETYEIYALSDTQAGLAFWFVVLIFIPAIFLLRKRIYRLFIKFVKRVRQTISNIESATRPEKD